MTNDREAAWDAAHEALPARWRVGRPSIADPLRRTWTPGWRAASWFGLEPGAESTGDRSPASHSKLGVDVLEMLLDGRGGDP